MGRLVVSVGRFVAGVLAWAGLVPGSADEGPGARFTGVSFILESAVMGLRPVSL